MPSWILWLALGTIASWIIGGMSALLIGRIFRLAGAGDDTARPGRAALDSAQSPAGSDEHGEEAVSPREDLHRSSHELIRILVVDDDPNLRALLRASFEAVDIEIDEADSSTSAAKRIVSEHPDVVVLDVGMPGVDGLTFCRGLKSDPMTRGIPVVLLTGSDAVTEAAGRAAGADAFLRKPFSPLALLTVAERLGARETNGAPGSKAPRPSDEQLRLYAEDFRRLVELERGQRLLLQSAYRETVTALARALESKDVDTGAHSERVRRYATELVEGVDASLLEEPSLEYGFILHDVGKIGIPDSVLAKPEPLTESERRLVETHTVLGEQMVGDAALLRGQGARVVRSHHERWDGHGYPDGLLGDSIPLGARVFAVADALDAMTSDRPYRPARSWEEAVAEIGSQAGKQFDPSVVDAFREREEALRRIYFELRADRARSS
jgi:ribonuclease P protein subunit RPR2